MEKKEKSIPEKLVQTYFAYMFAKKLRFNFPEKTDKQSSEKRQVFIDNCMELQITEFPQETLDVIILNVTIKTGKTANPKAKTVGELVRSLI